MSAWRYLIVVNAEPSYPLDPEKAKRAVEAIKKADSLP
jgi:hypothetical protein